MNMYKKLHRRQARSIFEANDKVLGDILTLIKFQYFISFSIIDNYLKNRQQ